MGGVHGAKVARCAGAWTRDVAAACQLARIASHYRRTVPTGSKEDHQHAAAAHWKSSGMCDMSATRTHIHPLRTQSPHYFFNILLSGAITIRDLEVQKHHRLEESLPGFGRRSFTASRERHSDHIHMRCSIHTGTTAMPLLCLSWERKTTTVLPLLSGGLLWLHFALQWANLMFALFSTAKSLPSDATRHRRACFVLECIACALSACAAAIGAWGAVGGWALWTERVVAYRTAAAPTSQYLLPRNWYTPLYVHVCLYKYVFTWIFASVRWHGNDS